MARFNRTIRPVNSLKHVVDTATAAVPAGVITTVILAQGTGNPTLANVVEVNQGSVINSMYLRVEAIHNSGDWTLTPRVYMTIFKNPGSNLVPPYPANVGFDDNKKFIIHQEMLMMTGINADANSFPRTVFNGVIKIPQPYRRVGMNDKINAQFSLDVGEMIATVTVCVQCIYKEFF